MILQKVRPQPTMLFCSGARLTSSSESTGPASTAPAENSKLPAASPEEAEGAKEPEIKKRRVSPVPEQPKPAATEDSKPAPEASSAARSSEPPPSKGLFIGNLIRPLNHVELKEMLGDYGQVEDFFIDKIKSRAYALVRHSISVFSPMKIGLTIPYLVL